MLLAAQDSKGIKVVVLLLCEMQSLCEEEVQTNSACLS